MHWQVAGVRRELRQALSQGEASNKTLLAEKELSKSLDGQLGGVWQQLGAERQSWQHEHARLTSEVWEARRLLDDNYCDLWGRLSAMQARAETAETALATLQARTERQKVLVGEPVQRDQPLLAPEPRKKKKRIKAAAEQKRLPAQASTLETIVMVAGSVVMGGTMALGAKALLGSNDRKRLSAKDVGTYFEVTPVPERKRLPPAK